MTIPPAKLWSRLWQCESINLRRHDNSFEANVSGTDARAYALAGLVEGIATPSGRVRYVRRLEHAAVATVAVKANEDIYRSNSTAFACTHMSAFKEALCEVEVAMQDDPAVSEPLEGRTFWPLPNGTPRNPEPIRVVAEEGEVSGFCYTLPPAPPSGWRTRVLAPTVCSAL